MFTSKTKPEPMASIPVALQSATMIGPGTTLKGDIQSQQDLRIDGTVIGNVKSSSKIIIGQGGVVEGDLESTQCDVNGKVNGNIRCRELLQLRGESAVTGNLYAGKLQIEPSATFNGQCHMGANIVEMGSNEQVNTAVNG
ncbi:MAG: polymer-forming cytoskeletal protein [Bacteroidetes bacterium]|nr:polymer-forming cytoskeletal protein [Bacteroidota bacterium]